MCYLVEGNYSDYHSEHEKAHQLRRVADYLEMMERANRPVPFVNEPDPSIPPAIEKEEVNG